MVAGLLRSVCIRMTFFQTLAPYCTTRLLFDPSGPAPSLDWPDCAANVEQLLFLTLYFSWGLAN